MCKIFDVTEREIITNSKKLEKILKADKAIKERWKQIVINGETYDYEVSDKGRVRKIVTKQILKPALMPNGYKTVCLSNREHVKHMFGIHRLIGIVFIPIPEKYINKGYAMNRLVVNHIDGYKGHNIRYNLEWCTVKENMTHAIDHNLVGYLGENSHLAKINEKTAIKICELISKGKTNKEISEKTGANCKMIQHIRSRECWCRVSKNYTFPRLGKAIPNTIDKSVIHEICKMLETKKYSDPEIGRKFNTSREYIRDIRLHKRQNKISCNYNF